MGFPSFKGTETENKITNLRVEFFLPTLADRSTHHLLDRYLGANIITLTHRWAVLKYKSL